MSGLETYCSEAGVASVFYITKVIFNILQIVIPVLLIISSIISLIALMTGDPDDKKQKKKLINKVAAAITIFAIPLIVNLIMALIATNGEQDVFNIADCWTGAEAVHNEKSGSGTGYDDSNDDSARIYGPQCIPIDGKYSSNCVQAKDGKWYECLGCKSDSTTHESSSGETHGGTSGTF